MPKRGCGDSRVGGGIYLELNLGPGGSPVEDFLLDPVNRVPKVMIDKKQIKARGINWYFENGVWHILDWVGEKHYPNAADFIEEVRHLGLSRLMSSTMEFERLTPESRHIIIHPKAHVYTSSLLVAASTAEPKTFSTPWICPKRDQAHIPGKLFRADESCVGSIWEMVSRGEPYEDGLSEDGEFAHLDSARPVGENIVVGEAGHMRLYKRGDPRLVRRDMPSFDYVARRLPDGFPSQVQAQSQDLVVNPDTGNVTLEWVFDKDGQPVMETVPNIGPGYLASFPISRIAVVKGERNGATSGETAARLTSETGIPVVEVDE